jgi:hypothetical protein
MRRSPLLPIVAILLLPSPRPGIAQVWEVGNQLLELSQPDYGDAFGQEFAVGDFDGDQIDDLAVGAAGPNIAAVEVFRGSPGGLQTPAWIHIEPDLGGGTWFGDVLAAGDFDGDGRDELAIGAPLYDNIVNLLPIDSSGRVFVYEYEGGSWSVTGSFSQSVDGIDDSPEPSDLFGSALVAADFGNDGYDDLAIGVRLESIGVVAAAGAVHVLYGTANGLTTSGSQFWHRSGGGIVGVAAAAAFGEALAAGDFDADGVVDLAIGGPSSQPDGECTGEVVVLYGVDGFGLGSTDQQAFGPADFGVAASCQQFGEALAAGELNGSPLCATLGNCADDLVIGAPLEDVEWNGGTVGEAGAVYVVFGSKSANGLFLSVAERFDSSHFDPAVMTAPESGDRFGERLAVGDLDRKGSADLAIGTPRESWAGVAESGFVHLLFSGSSPIVNGGKRYLFPRPGFASQPATETDRFGGGLAVGDFDGGGHGDLAVGLPSRAVAGFVGAGAVQILYGALFADGFERATTGGWTADAP